jgi:hypothetical protein
MDTKKFRLDWRNSPQKQLDSLQQMVQYLINMANKLTDIDSKLSVLDTLNATLLVIAEKVDSQNLLLQQVSDNTNCTCNALQDTNGKLDEVIEILENWSPAPPVPVYDFSLITGSFEYDDDDVTAGYVDISGISTKDGVLFDSLQVLYGDGDPFVFSSVSVLPGNVIRLFFAPSFSPSGSGTSFLSLTQSESNISQYLSYSYSAPVVNYVELTNGTVVPLRTAVDVAVLSSFDSSIVIGGNSYLRSSIAGVHIFDGPLFTDFSVPAYFCNNMLSLASLNIPGSVVSIGDYFLSGCSNFNGLFALPSSLVSIGSYFLNLCSGFNQPLVLPAGIESIGTYFLYSCISFNNPLVLPDSLAVVPLNFMQYCKAFNSMLTLPSSVFSIGSIFLYGCEKFNQPLLLPPSEGIGASFMSGCKAFNQPLDLPSNLVAVGANFMRETDSFVGPLGLGSLSPNIFSESEYTLAVFSSTVPAYVTGISVSGGNASGFAQRFPDSAGPLYRKLLVVMPPPVIDLSFSVTAAIAQVGIPTELETYSGALGQRVFVLDHGVPVNVRAALDCSRMDLRMGMTGNAQFTSFVFNSFDASEMYHCSVSVADYGARLHLQVDDGGLGDYSCVANVSVTIGGITIDNVEFRIYYF